MGVLRQTFNLLTYIDDNVIPFDFMNFSNSQSSNLDLSCLPFILYPSKIFSFNWVNQSKSVSGNQRTFFNTVDKFKLVEIFFSFTWLALLEHKHLRYPKFITKMSINIYKMIRYSKFLDQDLV